MKAAFNKIDVTPNYPVTMAGFNRDKKSEGCLDSIQINVLYWQCNRQTFILAVIDCLCVEREFVQEIQKECARKLNILESDIVVACTHTHSAPAYFKLAFENTKVNLKLRNEIKQKTIEAIIECSQLLVPVSVQHGTCTIEGCYGNRNDLNLSADKSVQQLKFYNDQNILIGNLFNISVHPTILNGSNYMLSSDLLGHLRDSLETILQAQVVVCNGACGDVSTRYFRQEFGLPELTRVSKDIVQQVIEKMEFKTLEITDLNKETVHHDYYFDFNHDLASQKHFLETNKKYQESENPFLRDRIILLNEKKRQSPFQMLLESNIIKMKDMFIITLPSDVVSNLGLRIKRELFPYHVILICYANQYSSYLVDQMQYGKFFETDNSRLEIGSADNFIELVIKKCKGMI